MFDLGVLLPEIAALEGETTVSMLVVPGAGTEKAAFNPTTFGFDNVPASGGYLKGLGPIADAAFADEFTVIDLRPLRAIAGMKRRDLDDELFRVIHGFDLLLVMSGSTPSGELEHD